jgi:hypothetical protein
VTDVIAVREEMRTFVGKLLDQGIEKDEAILILDHLFDVEAPQIDLLECDIVVTEI